MSQSAAEVSKIVYDITAKAQADEAFRARYLSDPAAVLAEAGLTVPSGVNVHVVEGAAGSAPASTASDVYLLLPTVSEVVQDESLDEAGGSASCQSTASTCFTVPSCASSASTASTNSCS